MRISCRNRIGRQDSMEKSLTMPLCVSPLLLCYLFSLLQLLQCQSLLEQKQQELTTAAEQQKTTEKEVSQLSSNVERLERDLGIVSEKHKAAQKEVLDYYVYSGCTNSPVRSFSFPGFFPNYRYQVGIK